MYKIIFSPEAYDYLDIYRQRYLHYFITTFTDTGIWSEDEIIKQYIIKGDERHNAIVDLIVERFSETIIVGRKSDNTLTIPWSWRNILVTFRDNWDVRYIEKILFT